jgi:hypothetical protein
VDDYVTTLRLEGRGDGRALQFSLLKSTVKESCRSSFGKATIFTVRACGRLDE